jgi:predicted Zn-dependent protease
MRKQHTTLAISFAVVLALSCGSGGDFNLISVEEEWQLGNQLAQDIARQMPVSEDPYITALGQRLVSQTAMANLPFRFHIVRNDEINAFAIPGGHVYIHTGLINAARNASELAGVMAHEIGHVTARHTTEQISRQYGLSVLAGMVLGQNPQAYQQLLAQIIGAGTLARYSRAAENEADHLAVRVMNQAGYNPEGMVTMFETLQARSQRGGGAVERFFATHPLTSDRIRDVRAEISRLPQKAARNDDAEFRALQARV